MLPSITVILTNLANQLGAKGINTAALPYSVTVHLIF